MSEIVSASGSDQGQTGFHWKREWVTPRLLTAIGSVVLEWAMIDEVISEMCQSLWHYEHLATERIPRSFDRRINELKRLAKLLYAQEPDEFRTYSWFDQRLRTANGKRDDICHGLPGRITKGTREYEGLHVPFPGRMPKYTPMAVDDIEALAEELKRLNLEVGGVHTAIWGALVASSQNILVGQAPYGLKPVAPGSRNPMLPRESPPPLTFQA